ncbi:MAG: hypothetical protein Nk1A_8490 [Endomicrobiia bacterium]|nr:MAG: hypothetical protein Nk1A_8490 [Endomicrobiia bacterium]
MFTLENYYERDLEILSKLFSKEKMDKVKRAKLDWKRVPDGDDGRDPILPTFDVEFY